MSLSFLSGRRSEAPAGAWRRVAAALRGRSTASSAPVLALTGALTFLPGGAGSSTQAFVILGVGVAAVLAVMLPIHWLLYAAILAIPFDNFAVPVGPLNISIADAVLVVVTLRWLLRVAASGGRIARSEIYAPAALFYALLLPSFFVTFDRAVSARLAFAILMMLMTAVVATNLLRRESRLTGAVTAILLASAAISLAALLQLAVWFLYHVPIFQSSPDVARIGGIRLLRLTATYFDPNYFALYLMGPIILGLFVGLEGHMSRRYRTFVWMVVSLDLVVLLLTFSRGGWVTLLAFMVVFVLLRAKAPSRTVWLAMLVVILIAAPLVATVLVRINPASVSFRLSLQKLGVEVMTEHPLTGTGLGTFRQLPQNRFKQPSHSTYLQIGADAGIPALIAYLMLGLVVMLNAVRALRVARDGPARAVLLGTVYALGCLAVQSALLDALIAKYLWIFIGLASAAAAVARADRTPVERSAPAPQPTSPLGQEG
jgi:putative inorganic carbon (HCO3(-)) transporter